MAAKKKMKAKSANEKYRSSAAISAADNGENKWLRNMKAIGENGS
jgi:hypothetical protein